MPAGLTANGWQTLAIVHAAIMKERTANLTLLGLGVAVAYWLTESLLHVFVFKSRSLADALSGDHDANELWMRLLITVLLVVFGGIADRMVRAERNMKEDAQRLNRLLHFLARIRQNTQRPVEERYSEKAADRSRQSSAEPAPTPGTMTAGGSGEAPGIEDLAARQDDIGELTRFLQELSSTLDVRFKELYALLELTHEINMGLLLDEVLDRAYETLHAVIPYDRLSVALIDEDGEVVRARWAKAGYAEVLLQKGYAGWLKGSSLREVISSEEPRILNDLVAYLDARPKSYSTRLMVLEGIRSSLTCPLISMGRPIGFMFFSSRTANTYKNAHVEIFKLIAGHLSVVVEKGNLYQQSLLEKERSEHLLLNVMPARIAARLRAGKQPVSEYFPEVSILFADIVEFTGFASHHSPDRVLDLLENIFVPLDRLCDVYGVEKIKTIGDQYMVISVPSGSSPYGHLRNLAEFALEALRLFEGMRYPDGSLVQVRMGMHSGPAVAGVVGQKKFAYDIWGDAVNVASRMESFGETGRIHVTEEVHSRLQDEFLFEERGTVDVRGKGPMTTFFLTAKK